MFPLAFAARSLQDHWWSFISRNYVVWPIFFLMNVSLLLKELIFDFLAHLSRRLTRWAYSIAMVRRPSVVVRRRPHFQSKKISNNQELIQSDLKPVYLWSQLANLDQILCVASLGWGKGCIRFWGRLDENSGFHGNRKPPLTYNGKNDVSTFSRLFLIGSFFILAGNEDMHKISDEFEFPPDWTTDYGVSCPWASKVFPIDL